MRSWDLGSCRKYFGWCKDYGEVIKSYGGLKLGPILKYLSCTFPCKLLNTDLFVLTSTSVPSAPFARNVIDITHLLDLDWQKAYSLWCTFLPHVSRSCKVQNYGHYWLRLELSLRIGCVNLQHILTYGSFFYILILILIDILQVTPSPLMLHMAHTHTGVFLVPIAV